MSATSRWSYTNTATVFPLEAEADGRVGKFQPTYGAPYQIACTWAGGGEKGGGKITGNNGEEFLPAVRYWHEDKRPKYGDLIARGVVTDKSLAAKIKSHIEYDMSFFGEEPDYMSVV